MVALDLIYPEPGPSRRFYRQHWMQVLLEIEATRLLFSNYMSCIYLNWLGSLTIWTPFLSTYLEYLYSCRMLDCSSTG